MPYQLITSNGVEEVLNPNLFSCICKKIQKLQRLNGLVLKFYIGNICNCTSSKFWMDDSASFEIFSFESECTIFIFLCEKSLIYWYKSSSTKNFTF